MKEKVIRVIDGDTFDTSSSRIRLANVYAPEINSLGGIEAKRKLQSLIDGKEVSITATGEVSYDRIVANVELNGYSINQVMNSFLSGSSGGLSNLHL